MWIPSSSKSRFQGVEILADTGYLISQFLSPLINIRNDDYGKTFENRLRFLIGILIEVKRKVSKKFLIIVRLSHEDWIDSSLTIYDTIKIVKIFQLLQQHF